MFGDFQMQQKAQRDAERRRRSEAISAQRMTSFRGLDRQQSILLNMQKAKVADRASMMQTRTSMAGFRGMSSRNMGINRGLSPVRQGKKTVDLELGTLMEEKVEKRISGMLPQPGQMRRRSSFGDFQEIQEELTNLQKETKSKRVKSDKKKKDKDKKSKKDKKDKKKDKDRSATRSSNAQKELNGSEHSSEKKEGKARKTVQLDFNFGIITDLDIIPDMSMIETASIFAVRDILQGSEKECGIRCDPDMPQVEPDVEEDVWYDSEYEIRWKLKGKVNVKIYILKSLDPMEAAEPVQKMLKRYSSYQEVEEAGGKVKSWSKVVEDKLSGMFF